MREKDGLETIKSKALEQTAEYAKSFDGTEAHLLIFDRDEKTDWRDKVYHEVAQHDGMTIQIWGV